MMDEKKFKFKYMTYCLEGGHSFDQYDVSAAWSLYQKNPTDYEYLNEPTNSNTTGQQVNVQV